MNANFERVIAELITQSLIPSTGIFQISESILLESIDIYGVLIGKKGDGLRDKSNWRFARKLAGLNLLKENFKRDANFNDMRSGTVYMIENPIFPDHYKIGMTINIKQRLNVYQTYDPFRRFRVVKYDFVIDRYTIEKEILSHPDISRENGEWIKKNNAVSIFEKICFMGR